MSTSLERRARGCKETHMAYRLWCELIGEEHGLKPPQPTRTRVNALLRDLHTLGSSFDEEALRGALRSYLSYLAKVQGAPSLSEFRALSEALVEEQKYAGLDLKVVRPGRRGRVVEESEVVGIGLVANKRAGNPQGLAPIRAWREREARKRHEAPGASPLHEAKPAQRTR